MKKSGSKIDRGILEAMEFRGIVFPSSPKGKDDNGTVDEDFESGVER